MSCDLQPLQESVYNSSLVLLPGLQLRPLHITQRNLRTEISLSSRIKVAHNSFQQIQNIDFDLSL